MQRVTPSMKYDYVKNKLYVNYFRTSPGCPLPADYLTALSYPRQCERAIPTIMGCKGVSLAGGRQGVRRTHSNGARCIVLVGEVAVLQPHTERLVEAAGGPDHSLVCRKN